jgi:hypothetical protein
MVPIRSVLASKARKVSVGTGGDIDVTDAVDVEVGIGIAKMDAAMAITMAVVGMKERIALLNILKLRNSKW